MTSFLIVFEILFLILIANPIEPLLELARSSAAAAEAQQRPPAGRHLIKPAGAQLIGSNRRQDASDHHSRFSDTTKEAFKKLQQTPRKRHRRWRPTRRRIKRESQDFVASLSGVGQPAAATIQPNNEPASSSSGQQLGPGRLAGGNGEAQPELSAAELCYLANGGSSLTLTVNEATPVGSVIGTIDVNGDPSLEGGNVDLLDGLEQAGGGIGASPVEPFVSLQALSSVARQNRRLFGRRDTSLRPVGSSGSDSTTIANTSPAAASVSSTTSSFYSLVATSLSPSSAGVTPAGASGSSSPASSLIQASQQQQQSVAVVRVQLGTKNLILARALDKESAEGESSQLVNVRCRPRQQPSGARKQSSSYTTIPIRLIITDANDHAPEFVGQLPYVINISETTPIGSIVSRDILALDKDSAGPHSTIHYRVLDSDEQHALATSGSSGQQQQQPLAAHFAFTNPLEPILTLTSPLDYESLLPGGSFVLSIAAQDQGEPEALQSIAQVQVNILDFDDQNPRFLDEKYTLVMDETQSSLVGQNLRVLPRNLRAEDGDRGINAPIVYSFDTGGGGGQLTPETGSGSDATAAAATTDELAAGIEQYLHLNPTTGELRLIRQWPTSGTGGLPLTLVVRATQADNRDRYALTTLTIVRSAGTTATAQPSGGGKPMVVSGSGSVGGTPTLTGSDQLLRATGNNGAPKRGIEFQQERLLVQVPEDTAVNEKIARVRAHHLQDSKPVVALASQQMDVAEPPGSTLTGARNRQQDQTDQVGAREVNSQQQTINRTTTQYQIGQQQQQHMRLVASGNSQTEQQQLQQQLRARPINYQILDDQTDQFGINGLGEIFLKRALDYEQRHEFKIRVLATYTKYSDICHVQIVVLNVNDNKPKFTQTQYSFHLTESRLRSNLIGLVQAHDADFNDTIHYSILSAGADQQLAVRLFEIGPATGQLSLRAGVRQLNASQYQLVVQASDSLGPGASHHKQQARVTIYVTAQIVGRSLNLAQGSTTTQEHGEPAPAATTLAGQDHEARLYNSQYSLQSTESVSTNWPPRKSSRDFAQRLLKDHNGNNNSNQNNRQPDGGSTAGGEHWLTTAESSTVPSHHHRRDNDQPEVYTSGAGQQQQQQPPAPSSQRSSLATVMASLQHMMKSVNFFEMPMSSALLLTVLLTFLVCLLLIVVISMSVHVYRRSSKARSRRRRHHHHHQQQQQQHRLAAATRLRHAHHQLTVTGPTPEAGAGGPSLSSASHSSPYLSSSSSGSSSISSPVPALTSAAQALYQRGRAGKETTTTTSSNPRNYYDNLALATLTDANKPGAQTGGLEANRSSLTNSTSVATSHSSSAEASRVSSASSPSLLLLASGKHKTTTTSVQTKSKSGAGSDKQTKKSKIKTTTTTNQKHGKLGVMRDDDGEQLPSAMACDGKQFGALKISISNETTTIFTKPAANETYLRSVGPSKQNPLYLETSAPTTTQTNASSKQQHSQGPQSGDQLTIGSSCLTSDDDDDDGRSSATNCGHYSVNGTMEHGRRSVVVSPLSPLRATKRNKCETLESAISKLVGQQHEEEQEANKENGGAPKRPNGDSSNSKATPRAGSGAATAASSKQTSGSGQSLALDSYRRLPLMNSLVRPTKTTKSQLLLSGPGNFGAAMSNRVAPIEQLLSSHQQRVEQAAQVAAAAAAQHRANGLMAMVRGESNHVKTNGLSSGSNNNQDQQQQIKWPSESIPQRIKKLTWDDELSCYGDNESISFETGGATNGVSSNHHQLGQQQQLRFKQTSELESKRANQGCGGNHNDDDDDCYISPNIRFGSASGGAERELHRYELDKPGGEADEQAAAGVGPPLGNQFLFSLNNQMLPSLSQQRPNGGGCGDQLLSSSQYHDDDQNEEATTLASHASGGRNQNNCLDYTIVNNSQFHADSLAGVSSAPSEASHTGSQRSDYFARLTSQMTSQKGRDSTVQQQRQHDDDDRDNHLDDNHLEHSLAASSQTNVTFKLNQNYQDLRLMTTAIL